MLWVLVALCVSTTAALAEPTIHGARPLLSVQFTSEGSELSGLVDSEETAQAIARAVQMARSEMPIINKGLTLRSDVSIPDLSHFKSILTELGLSTHNGGIRLYEDTIVITGETDSLVTLSALRIRIEPILGQRQLISQLCIVSTDDLPNLAISLSSGEKIEVPELTLEFQPTPGEGFRPPGIALEKLALTIVSMIDVARWDANAPDSTALTTSNDTGTAPGTTSITAPLVAEPIRAIPIALTSESDSTPTLATSLPDGLLAPDIPLPPPAPRFDVIGSVFFARNTHLLQANQTAAVEAIASSVQQPASDGRAMIVRAFRASSGGGALGDYLADRRMSETRRMLQERGVDVSQLTTEIVAASASTQPDEIRVLLQQPLPEPSPEVTAPDLVNDLPSPSQSPGEEPAAPATEPEGLRQFRLKGTPKN